MLESIQGLWYTQYIKSAPLNSGFSDRRLYNRLGQTQALRWILGNKYIIFIKVENNDEM